MRSGDGGREEVGDGGGRMGKQIEEGREAIGVRDGQGRERKGVGERGYT